MNILTIWEYMPNGSQCASLASITLNRKGFTTVNSLMHRARQSSWWRDKWGTVPRARSQKQQKEASKRATPDARERIPTGAGGSVLLFYGA